MDIFEDIYIYWINLERCTDRKEKMRKQLNEFKINNQLCITAIDGNELDLSKFENKYNINKYEMACAMSHLKAIQTAYDNNLDYVIIMEDDCSFEYLKYQKISIKNLFLMKPDCDILQLAICCRQDHNENILKKKELLIKGHRDCATAYMINRNGMKKIIDNIDINNINLSEKIIYDNAISYYVSRPYFTYYYSNIFTTTIHMNDKNYVYKREDLNKKFWDEYYTSQVEKYNQ